MSGGGQVHPKIPHRGRAPSMPVWCSPCGVAKSAPEAARGPGIPAWRDRPRPASAVGGQVTGRVWSAAIATTSWTPDGQASHRGTSVHPCRKARSVGRCLALRIQSSPETRRREQAGCPTPAWVESLPTKLVLWCRSAGAEGAAREAGQLRRAYADDVVQWFRYAIHTQSEPCRPPRWSPGCSPPCPAESRRPSDGCASIGPAPSSMEATGLYWENV